MIILIRVMHNAIDIDTGGCIGVGIDVYSVLYINSTIAVPVTATTDMKINLDIASHSFMYQCQTSN